VKLVDLPAGRQARTHMTYFVYAIKSLTKNYIYVGLTNNLTRRFNQHNQGREKTTRLYRPFKVILIEDFDTRIKARNKEKHYKSGCGKEYLKKIK